jgi:hypothetical protein
MHNSFTEVIFQAWIEHPVRSCSSMWFSHLREGEFRSVSHSTCKRYKSENEGINLCIHVIWKGSVLKYIKYSMHEAHSISNNMCLISLLIPKPRFVEINKLHYSAGMSTYHWKQWELNTYRTTIISSRTKSLQWSATS